MTDRPPAGSYVRRVRNQISDLGITTTFTDRSAHAAHKPEMEITPPEGQCPGIEQDADQDSRSRPEDIGISNQLPTPAAVAQDRCRASVQEMKALQNLPVLEVRDGFEMKHNRAAPQAAKQTNPLREAAYSQPSMGQLPDLDSGISLKHQVVRMFRVSRPDT